jgi:hypothetical protein
MRWPPKASGEENADPAAAAEFLAAEHPDRDEDSQDASGQPLSWYADSAYGTGDLRDAIGQAGDAAVIKPKPLAPAVEGGFTLDDFTVNEDDGTVTCPTGSPGGSPPAATSPSEPPAAAARCAPAAPLPKPAAPSSCTNTTTCCAPPAVTGPGCGRTT